MIASVAIARQLAVSDVVIRPLLAGLPGRRPCRMPLDFHHGLLDPPYSQQDSPAPSL